MPVSVSVICIRKEKAQDFLEKKRFLEIKENIFLQKEDSDGLYLAMAPSRGGYSDFFSEMDEKDYLYLNVDDEDDYSIEGSFIPPEEVGLVVNMSIVAINMKEERLAYNLDYYDCSLLKRLKENDTEKFSELKSYVSDTEGEEHLEEINAICPEYDYESYGNKKLAFFELGFDTSLSTGSTFILTFNPLLQNIIKWKDIIDDELNEWESEYEDDEDNFAYSLYTTCNYDLLESVKEDLELSEGLRNYPSLIFFGLHGNAQEGWDE